MSTYTYDQAVIGGGPGGYVAAVRASQLRSESRRHRKRQTRRHLRNWGCIPSKALINQAEAYHAIEALEHMGVKVDVTGLDYSKVQAKSRAAADSSGKGTTYLMKKNKVDVIAGTAVLTAPTKSR